MKKILTAFLLTLSASTMAQTVLFHTGDATGYPYRIPAITTTAQGKVVALTDIRPCGGDIGYGRVDILGRTSLDGGATWGNVQNVLVGTGSGPETGYGDACLVADSKREELLSFRGSCAISS